MAFNCHDGVNDTSGACRSTFNFGLTPSGSGKESFGICDRLIAIDCTIPVFCVDALLPSQHFLTHLSQRLTGQLYQLLWLLSVNIFRIFSPETTGPIELKYHMETPYFIIGCGNERRPSLKSLLQNRKRLRT